MKIIDALLSAKVRAVLFDQRSGVVRLWTLSQVFQDGRKLKALRRWFPYLEVRGRIIRLGGYNNLSEGTHDLANAKVYSNSNSVQSLYKFDTIESLASIKHFS